MLFLYSLAVVIAIAGFIIVVLMMRACRELKDTATEAALRWMTGGFVASGLAYGVRLADPHSAHLGYLSMALCLAGTVAIYKGWIGYWRARRELAVARMRPVATNPITSGRGGIGDGNERPR